MSEIPQFSNLVICHCGNSPEKHNFRHKFEPCCTVEKRGEIFYLDANKFPEKTKERCSVENCTYSRSLHLPDFVKHEYSPVSTSFREIRFVLPQNTTCLFKDCKKTVEQHSNSVGFHPITVKIVIENKRDTDRVIIEDGIDRDNKVIWN